MGSIAEAASSGDRHATLIAMREKLAQDMDDATPSVVAQIAGRLSAVLLELDEIPVGAEVSTLDDLDAKRKSRVPGSEQLPSARAPRRHSGS
jgi:hypothetical protein